MRLILEGLFINPKNGLSLLKELFAYGLQLKVLARLPNIISMPRKLVHLDTSKFGIGWQFTHDSDEAL